MNRYFTTLAVAVCLLLGTVTAQPARAQLPTIADTSAPSSWLTIVPSDCQDANGCDICEVTKVFTNAATLIGSLLSAIALLMFVVGGLFLIFSAGNETRVETGKKILIGTVTGLAIIFLAWLAINILVRTVALSGGSSTGTLFKGQTFSKEWWTLEGCYPALLTECKGHFIGEACGGPAFGECAAGTVDKAVCQCYRYVSSARNDKSGNIKCEGTDKVNLTDVDKGTDDGAANTTNACGCFSGCNILKGQTGAEYACTPQTTVDAANKTKAGSYITRTDASCVTSGYVCALKGK